MTPWIEVDLELPAPYEIVDVWLALGQRGNTRLSGYRLPSRPGADALWLNALTHEPFPAGWLVQRWRKAWGVLVEQHLPDPQALPRLA